MSPEPIQVERRFFADWVRGTFFGWLLGFVLVIVLSIALDLLGISAQFMVGVGMGAGVGYVQGRVARPWLGGSATWAWASTLGMGGPFVFGDVANIMRLEFPFSLPIYVVTGGLLAGLLQRRLLRSHTSHANWWVPASTAGWALPVGAVALSDWLQGPWGDVVFLAVIPLGGVVLGVVTGGTLVWLFQRPAT